MITSDILQNTHKNCSCIKSVTTGLAKKHELFNRNCTDHATMTDDGRTGVAFFSWRTSAISYQSKNIKEFPSVEVQQGTNIRVDLFIHRSLSRMQPDEKFKDLQWKFKETQQISYGF